MATHASSANRIKTRLALLALLVLFLTPMVIARVAYNQGWLEGAARPHTGHLMVPPVALVELNAQLESTYFTASDIPKAWWLVYMPPPDCQRACRNSLYTLNRVTRALNQEQTQVKQLLIKPDSHEQRLHSLLEEQGLTDLHITTATPQAANNALRDHMTEDTRATEAGYIYLMNPRGSLLMYYRPVENAQDLERRLEEIREDVQGFL